MTRAMTAERLKEAIALHRAGDLESASRLYEKILKADPQHADALHLLGSIRLQGRDGPEGIRLITRAIEIAPDIAIYHLHLADAHHRRGDRALAESECLLSIRLDPGLAKAHNLLGLIRLEAGEPDAAIDSFSRAIDIAGGGPSRLDAMVNLSVAFNRKGEHEMASRQATLVLGYAPNHSAAWLNLGMAMRGAGHADEAKNAFRRAGENPMARFNLGYVLLQQNDLAGGLPLCEERKKVTGIGEGLRTTEWDGRPAPESRLLILPEQGLGDTILMSRFFPILLDRFAHVTVLAQEALARLLATIDERLEVVTGSSASDIPHDLWCATMSIPYLLGIDSIEKIPNEPWFRLRELGARKPGKPRVGINWAGNPSFAYDAVRSTRLEKLAMLFEVADVDWISLHKGHLEREAEERGLPQPLRGARDFYDTALVVRDCDLVVSTETAIPNLSAALGIPTCVLTSRDPDWRWGAWYPKAIVCRQESAGNWFGPIAKTLEVIRTILIRVDSSPQKAAAA